MKILGLKHLQFPKMGASSGPPDWACIIHHRMEDLLVQQNTIPDGQNTPPVQVRSQHYQTLYHFLSPLISMSWPGKPCIKGNPKITGGIDPVDWPPEGLSCSGFQDVLTGLSKIHWWPSSILSATTLGHWDISPGIWWAVLADRTWLWWSCRLCRDTVRCGRKAKACRHAGWMGWVKLFHPKPRQHAYDNLMLLFGRMLLSNAWAGQLLSTAIAGLPAQWLAGRQNS